MSYRERTDEEIVEAWEVWCEGHPNPEEIAFNADYETYSPHRIVKELRDMLELRRRGEKIKNEFLWHLLIELPKKDAKEKGYDPVEFLTRRRP